MDSKYSFYLKWVYTQLNGSINSTVPCKKCILVKGDHYTKTNNIPLLGGYAAVDEIGIYYETLQKNIFYQDYSEEEKKAICIHIVLHELSHLSQDYANDVSAYYEIANDINVYNYMKSYDYDIRMKCGEYDLDYIEDFITSRLVEYQKRHNTNEIPKYHYITAKDNKVQKYLESHLRSAIPDFVKNFQIRYYTLDKKYITWVIKDGIRTEDRNIINALNFSVHNNMKDCQTDAYQKLHMDQNILYLDIVHHLLYQSLIQKHNQHMLAYQQLHV